tara:strand:- start:199 stop:528 length:330 start_codon:yes stop_codon:yes gene_type:complete
MNNCKHETHHNDCCVCWWKQAHGKTYVDDIPLFMDKMVALLSGTTWYQYCMDKALGTAKEAVERYDAKWLNGKIGEEYLLDKCADLRWVEMRRLWEKSSKRARSRGWSL